MNTPNQGDVHVVQMAEPVPAADQTCIAQCVDEGNLPNWYEVNIGSSYSMLCYAQRGCCSA
jgi:hypothetical protein